MRHWLGMAACAWLGFGAAHAESGFIQANGVSLHYDRAGSRGSTIVLLHEIGMSLASWNEVVPQLQRNHHVLRYDLRGFGLSQKITGSITLADEVADLHGLIEALHITGKVDLVGGAVGGNIALAYAAQYPDQVARVIDISPIVSAPAPRLVKSAPRGPMGPSPADIIAKFGMHGYLNQQADSLYPPALRTPARYALFTGLQLSSEPNSRIATVRMASSGDFGTILPRVQCPALMVATIDFTLKKPSDVQALAASLPHGSFLALPTGHLAALASPDLVARAILDFTAP